MAIKLNSWGQFCSYPLNSTASPGFCFFSISMGADYSIELISIETYASQFIGHNKMFLGSVYLLVYQVWN
jgi:hypothetical protein